MLNSLIQIKEIILNVVKQNKDIHIWMDYDLTIVNKNHDTTIVYDIIENITNSYNNKITNFIITGESKHKSKDDPISFQIKEYILNNLKIIQNRVYTGFYHKQSLQDTSLTDTKLRFISQYYEKSKYPDAIFFIDDEFHISCITNFILSKIICNVHIIAPSIYTNEYKYYKSNKESEKILKSEDIKQIGSLNDVITEMYLKDIKLNYGLDFHILSNKQNEYNFKITKDGQNKINKNKEFSDFNQIYSIYKDALVNDIYNLDYNVFTLLNKIIDSIESYPIFGIAYDYLNKINLSGSVNEFKNTMKNIFINSNISKDGYSHKISNLFVHIFIGQYNGDNKATGGLHSFYRTLYLSNRKSIRINNLKQYKNMQFYYQQSTCTNLYKPNECIIGCSPIFELLIYTLLLSFYSNVDNYKDSYINYFEINKIPLKCTVYSKQSKIISAFVSSSYTESSFSNKVS